MKQTRKSIRLACTANVLVAVVFMFAPRALGDLREDHLVDAASLYKLADHYAGGALKAEENARKAASSPASGSEPPKIKGVDRDGQKAEKTAKEWKEEAKEMWQRSWRTRQAADQAAQNASKVASGDSSSGAQSKPPATTQPKPLAQSDLPTHTKWEFDPKNNIATFQDQYTGKTFGHSKPTEYQAALDAQKANPTPANTAALMKEMKGLQLINDGTRVPWTGGGEVSNGHFQHAFGISGNPDSMAVWDNGRVTGGQASVTPLKDINNNRFTSIGEGFQSFYTQQGQVRIGGAIRLPQTGPLASFFDPISGSTLSQVDNQPGYDFLSGPGGVIPATITRGVTSNVRQVIRQKTPSGKIIDLVGP